MSPDIEWHVGEDAEQETIVRTSGARRPRRSLWAVLIAIGLGAGLGFLYRSIPEPPARPSGPAPVPAFVQTPSSPLPAPVTSVPTLHPTSMPPTPPLPVARSALENAILREARALADGDAPGYIATQDADLYQRRQDALGLYSVWGRPATDQPYYTIRQTGTVSADTVWAEVIQYRDGQFFRDIRFFRRVKERWVRTRAVSDSSFWGALQTASTNHFNVIYRARDAEAVRAAVSYLQHRYAQICRTFDCADQAGPHALSLVFQPGILEASISSDQTSRHLTITLPTPGTMGLYYSTLEATTLGRNNRLDEFFDHHFLLPALFEAAGGADRWLTDTGGVMYVQAIRLWELERQGRLPAGEFPYQSELLADNDQLLPLDVTWTSAQADDLARAQTSALIQFVDETYGPDAVIEFFRSLRTARSLAQAIEFSGLPYGDFEAKWAIWLEQQRNG